MSIFVVSPTSNAVLRQSACMIKPCAYFDDVTNIIWNIGLTIFVIPPTIRPILVNRTAVSSTCRNLLCLNERRHCRLSILIKTPTYSTLIVQGACMIGSRTNLIISNQRVTSVILFPIIRQAVKINICT